MLKKHEVEKVITDSLTALDGVVLPPTNVNEKPTIAEANVYKDDVTGDIMMKYKEDCFSTVTPNIYRIKIIYGEDDIPVQKHGYWTGRLLIDDAHSEGFSPDMTEEEKEIIRENDKHVTHCSVCGGMFDDRKTRDWKGCPYCLSIMDLERPEDSYYLSFEKGWGKIRSQPDNTLDLGNGTKIVPR